MGTVFCGGKNRKSASFSYGGIGYLQTTGVMHMYLVTPNGLGLGNTAIRASERIEIIVC